MSKPELMPWRSDGSTIGAGHLLLVPVLGEICDAAGTEHAEAFFRAVGARLARGHSLDALQSDREILGSLNALWAEWGWGYVVFEHADKGLRIHHADLPHGDDAGSVRWTDIAVSVLAGAYGQWLSSLGGGSAAVRIVAVDGQAAEFLYGT